MAKNDVVAITVNHVFSLKKDFKLIYIKHSNRSTFVK